VADPSITRASLLRAGAALAAGGAALVIWPEATPSAPSARQDVAILSFALLIEDLQAAFYADALRRGALTGELLEYAQVVGGHERVHAAHIRTALGSGAKRAARFDFRDVNADPVSFTSNAIMLEDLGVSAYNGAATSLTHGALADAGRIVSVEARHASWIRDIAGKVPAPRPADHAVSAKQVQAAIDRTRFVR
jgi:hypothetical protein